MEGAGPKAGWAKAKRGMSEVEGDKGRIKALPVPPAQSRLPRSLVVLANVLLQMSPVCGAGARFLVTALPEQAPQLPWAAPGSLPGSSSWEAS